MRIVVGFIRFALTSIGWEVEQINTDLVATDLHGRRYRIKVTPCE